MSYETSKYILAKMRDDMCAEPSRPLTERETEFVKLAEDGHLSILYTRRGKPFAVGPAGNEDRWPFSVRTHSWPFDSDTRIYSTAAT
jgi:hypothetical protein